MPVVLANNVIVSSHAMSTLFVRTQMVAHCQMKMMLVRKTVATVHTATPLKEGRDKILKIQVISTPG